MQQLAALNPSSIIATPIASITPSSGDLFNTTQCWLLFWMVFSPLTWCFLPKIPRPWQCSLCVILWWRCEHSSSYRRNASAYSCSVNCSQQLPGGACPAQRAIGLWSALHQWRPPVSRWSSAHCPNQIHNQRQIQNTWLYILETRFVACIHIPYISLHQFLPSFLFLQLRVLLWIPFSKLTLECSITLVRRPV